MCENTQCFILAKKVWRVVAITDSGDCVTVEVTLLWTAN